MQPELEKLRSGRPIFFSLVAAVIVILAANMFGKDVAIVVSDLSFVAASGALLVLAILISARFGASGDHGKAYLLFSVFVASWFAAEAVWMVSEVMGVMPPIPQEAEILYLGGYPFLFLFSLYYIKPLQKAITKKMLAYASLATITFLIPTLYTTYSGNPSADFFQIIWAGIYPVADAAVLFPAVLGMALFFKGHVNFFWSLACIAIILNIVADTGFLFLFLDESYYSGHPLDMLYLWAYVLFSFGINSHLSLYKKKKIKSYDNIEDLK